MDNYLTLTNYVDGTKSTFWSETEADAIKAAQDVCMMCGASISSVEVMRVESLHFGMDASDFMLAPEQPMHEVVSDFMDYLDSLGVGALA